MTCTIFKNIFSKEPHYIGVTDALNRISSGRSLLVVKEIRETIDIEKAGKLKNNLPSVCFSGKFSGDRTDGGLIEHSGFVVLDFDHVNDLRNRQSEIISNDFVYACWVSPSGTGLKALIKIADPKKHREHFQALQDVFTDVDKSGINPSRVCYESYDPEIYINQNAKVFKSIKTVERILVTENADEQKTFTNLLTWISNRKESFVTGERNNFIFKLASACCRFGISELSTLTYINNEFLIKSDFSKSEADRTIKSAYRANKSKFGDAVFEKETLVEKVTKKEIQVESLQFDENEKPKDVIYGIDVKSQALQIHERGYELVKGIGIAEVDWLFKLKRGEITLISGYGNHGKTALKKWYLLMRSLIYDEKFATFSPEENPPEEYYHDLVEILLGCDCTPMNPNSPTKEIYERAYDFVSKHFFYVYPKELAPTPEYVKERFLELIVKEKIDGGDIDPFNQMSNDYGKGGRSDKYLESFLGDWGRFAQVNNIYSLIIAHPVKAHKDSTGNYPCPDVFDIADGAMWNNKMDNILIYNRPFFQSAPDNPMCEFHSKKIKRQKTVGKRGFTTFEMVFPKRRFFFNGIDPMRKVITDKGFDFDYSGQSVNVPRSNMWIPFKDENGEEVNF